MRAYDTSTSSVCRQDSPWSPETLYHNIVEVKSNSPHVLQLRVNIRLCRLNDAVVAGSLTCVGDRNIIDGVLSSVSQSVSGQGRKSAIILSVHMFPDLSGSTQRSKRCAYSGE